MFTGIIEATAPIHENRGSVLRVGRPKAFTDIREGSSIAVSGVCLTVSSLDNDSLTFDVVPETLRVSNLSEKTAGEFVNLERAVPSGGRLDGHVVQGHVEGVGLGLGLGKEENVLSVRLPKNLIKNVVQKGSITLDGVSLTVATISDDVITVALVPHTLKNTTLGSLKKNQKINIETDILARYA